ncbi:hypothetical protein P5837_30515, partial [Bacillus cereus]|nr:hypothetical protein [Bacillus cereus]
VLNTDMSSSLLEADVLCAHGLEGGGTEVRQVLRNSSRGHTSVQWQSHDVIPNGLVSLVSQLAAL